jgi:hypothetical protein
VGGEGAFELAGFATVGLGNRHRDAERIACLLDIRQDAGEGWDRARSLGIWGGLVVAGRKEGGFKGEAWPGLLERARSCISAGGRSIGCMSGL